MTAKRLHLLVLACGACCAGWVSAGSGDITQRDAEGSLELSNLGEQDAAVVVAAPAGKAVAAPESRASAVALARPLPQRVPTKKSRSAADQEDEEAVDAESTESAVAMAAGRGAEAAGQGVANPDGMASQSYASGVASGIVGGAATSPAPGTGAPVSGGAPAESTGNGGTGSLPGSPWQGGGTQGGTGSGQMASVLDSPELLAQRLAQYRELMLSEPRPNGGLVANPAVQRRYLMMNRSGYMGTFR